MIGAVVVLYNPDLNITSELLDSLTTQVSNVVVIDNSADAAIKQPTELGVKPADYLHFPDNIGLAAAHNKGLEKLVETGCEYGVIFDQDSLVADGFIEGLKSSLDYGLKHHNMVAVGPQVWCSFDSNDVRPRVQKRQKVKADLEIASQIISSGMMLHLPSLTKVGKKDERLFIDGVDHEWCWRARAKGYKVGIATNIIMPHRLGDERKTLLGITYKVGSPIRMYYQFRNNLLLSRRGYVPTYWKIRNLTLMGLKVLVQSTTHRDGKLRFKYMMKGIKDGLVARTGKISKY